MNGIQRHRLRKMTGRKDVYLDGHLYLQDVDGELEFINITVPDIRILHYVECRQKKSKVVHEQDE